MLTQCLTSLKPTCRAKSCTLNVWATSACEGVPALLPTCSASCSFPCCRRTQPKHGRMGCTRRGGSVYPKLLSTAKASCSCSAADDQSLESAAARAPAVCGEAADGQQFQDFVAGMLKPGGEMQLLIALQVQLLAGQKDSVSPNLKCLLATSTDDVPVTSHSNAASHILGGYQKLDYGQPVAHQHLYLPQTFEAGTVDANTITRPCNWIIRQSRYC